VTGRSPGRTPAGISPPASCPSLPARPPRTSERPLVPPRPTGPGLRPANPPGCPMATRPADTAVVPRVVASAAVNGDSACWLCATTSAKRATYSGIRAAPCRYSANACPPWESPAAATTACWTASSTVTRPSRWSVALALELRQGEALGLRWQYVDLDAGTLTVRWQLQRLPWRHG